MIFMILVTRCVTEYVDTMVAGLASSDTLGEKVVIMVANKTDLARARKVTEKQVKIEEKLKFEMSNILNRDVTLQ